MTGTLDGLRVLVTGANRGIGAALVAAALDRGAAHVVAAARTPAPSEDPRVTPVRLDVTERAYPDVEVDLLVSNAGVPCYGKALNEDEEPLRQALEVNLFGPLALVRAVRPTRGIVFVQSVASVALSRSAPGYSASKSAALMTALGVREESPGLQVTVALPGFVDTDMSKPLQMPKADPLDVAGAILDGWAAGENTVWPDPFAQRVRESIGSAYERWLDAPAEVMTAVQAAYRPTIA